MRKKLIWAAIGLSIVALLAWALMPTPMEVETASVTLGRFERAIQEDGKTRLRERYVISMPMTGRISRIHLKQGDALAQGATVATLQPSAPALLDERSRAQQVAGTAALQSALERSRANQARASAALDQARVELKRSETLAVQGFISVTQLENDRLSSRLRETELESARQEALAARHTLEQSRAALKTYSGASTQNPQRTVAIASPISGNVLKIWQQSEGVVLAGTPLLELGDPQRLEVVVDVLSEEAAQIQSGALVHLPNWGGATVLEGRVRIVEPAAFTKVSALGVEEQRVNTVVDILSPPEQWATLGDGYKVDVRILMQAAENVLLLPVSALFPAGPGSAVMVVDEGTAKLRTVEVAARNGSQAWIRSGVSLGTEVIVYPDTKLRDGDRVNKR